MGIFVVAVGVLLLIVAVRGGLNCIWDGIALTFESDEAKKQAYLKDLATKCLGPAAKAPTPTAAAGNPPAGVGH